jgi:hypothetical protein
MLKSKRIYTRIAVGTSSLYGIKVVQRELYENEKEFLITDSELAALLKYG